MSQANVELVRTLLEMFARRDHEGVFTIRDGKVTRWRSYPDQEQALSAVGLRE